MRRAAIGDGQSKPTWTNGLSVASIAGGRVSNFYDNPAFDLANGIFFFTSQWSEGGHEPRSAVSLVDGSVLGCCYEAVVSSKSNRLT